MTDESGDRADDTSEASQGDDELARELIAKAREQCCE
jgi:hypothetical protein